MTIFVAVVPTAPKLEAKATRKEPIIKMKMKRMSKTKMPMIKVKTVMTMMTMIKIKKILMLTARM